MTTTAEVVRRARVGWAISGVLTALWALVVTGSWSRVSDFWASASTMLFGSFLAGSSPEGGGAVAFPVFTKGLHVPAAVARTFGLSIQAVGMTVAAIAILINRRSIHLRATVLGSIAGVVGFLLALVLFGDREALFWPSDIPSAWVKATFSIVLATTSVMLVRQLASDIATPIALPWNHRLDIGVVLIALAGGALASMTGTGANILLFLFLVLLADVRPKVALASVVIVMGLISLVGVAVLGVIDGQLFVEVENGRVIEVGGTATDLPADRNDLFGLWFAAVPVVVWGAPLGSWVASKVREKQLIGFVAVLAAAEVLTTFILVSEIRTDGALLTYLLTGLVVFPASIIWLRRRRHQLFRAQSLGS